MKLLQFLKQFPTEQDCLDHLFRVRYGQDYICPSCERPGSWYPIKGRRAYSCQWCGHHEYPCVGTPFERSRTDLRLWFYAIYLFTTSRHGVAAKELERTLGVTYKCAWRMAHEIRKHMARVDGDPSLSGEVEIDETFMGGHRPGKRGRGAAGKTILMGMLQRDGNVMTKVIPGLKRQTVYPVILNNVDKGATLHTDEMHSYRGLDQHGYEHKTVNHGAGEYARDGSHVNSLENYWSRLKTSIRGTHIWVSGKHLPKYAGEFEYRFNSRHHPDRMFPELISSFLPLRKE